MIKVHAERPTNADATRRPGEDRDGVPASIPVGGWCCGYEMAEANIECPGMSERGS
jgi:hypothetical protein